MVIIVNYIHNIYYIFEIYSNMNADYFEDDVIT